MKYFLSLALVFFVSEHVLSQCVSGDCNNGQGTYKYSDETEYTGQFKDGKAHGQGTAKYKIGSRYVGEFRDHMFNGKGTMYNATGDKWSGVWKDNEKVPGTEYTVGCIDGDCENGKGKYVYEIGTEYEGEFRNGLPHGYGTCRFYNGDEHTGAWKDNKQDGEGTYRYADGTVKTGTWKDGVHIAADAASSASGCISGNCENGYGTYKYSDGAQYIGEFKNGLSHGQGSVNYPNGAKYIGELRDHKLNGRGTMYYADDTHWSGVWKDDEKVTGTEYTVGCLSGDCFNGKGVYVYDNGTRYEGEFKNGLIEGYGVSKFYNGDEYTGLWKNHKIDGEGFYRYADGTTKVGIWREGSFVGTVSATKGCISGDCDNGFGILVYNDGRYTGDFKAGKPEGQGTLIWSDGNKYTGAWKNGLAHGYGTMYNKDGSVVSGYYEKNQKVEKIDQTPTPKIWAVVVGVAFYHHINSLRYTKDDAYRMYAFLKSPEGGALPDNQIQILVDEDARRDNIVQAIRKIFGQAGKDDLVLFYFSGHGMPGAFLPYDFDGESNYLYHEQISQVLKDCSAKYKVCIADACHSGSLEARQRGLSNNLEAFYDVLKKSTGGTALIMSSKAEETSIEFNSFRQGVFTYYLIQGLKGAADSDADKIVTIKELFNYVQREVRNYTSYQQNPVLSGTFDTNMPLGLIR